MVDEDDHLVAGFQRNGRVWQDHGVAGFPQLAIRGGQVGEDLGEHDLAFFVEVKGLVNPKLDGAPLPILIRARHFPKEHAVHAAVGQLGFRIDARQKVKVAHNLVVELGPKLPVHLAHLLA